MTDSFKEYQAFTRTTAIYPGAGSGEDIALAYLGLGLASEAGEVAGAVKKLMRDGVFDQDSFLEEVGDCLWYLSMIASELGVPLGDLAQGNMDKLQSRKERGVLGGNGDNR